MAGPLIQRLSPVINAQPELSQRLHPGTACGCGLKSSVAASQTPGLESRLANTRLKQSMGIAAI